MRIAVIVTTYNRPDALALVLAGYRAQSERDFELIVADDGSTAATADAIDGFKASAPFALSHVWHEDRGFRVSAIRNRAIATTGADYIIFSDGDCVPARHFVARHRALAERGWFLSGNRILLSEDFTRVVLLDGIPIHAWRAPRWVRVRLQRDANRLLPLLTLPDGVWRKRRPGEWRGAKTCNLSVWRDDLLRIDGFDESYSGWGLEDSDLAIRLLRSGISHKNARYAAPVFHLWHAENDRSKLIKNQQRLDEILQSQRVRARIGIASPGIAAAAR